MDAVIHKNMEANIEFELNTAALRHEALPQY
jgi:hypothetical protein